MRWSSPTGQAEQRLAAGVVVRVLEPLDQRRAQRRVVDLGQLGAEREAGPVAHVVVGVAAEPDQAGHGQPGVGVGEHARQCLRHRASHPCVVVPDEGQQERQSVLVVAPGHRLGQLGRRGERVGDHRADERGVGLVEGGVGRPRAASQRVVVHWEPVTVVVARAIDRIGDRVFAGRIVGRTARRRIVAHPSESARQTRDLLEGSLRRRTLSNDREALLTRMDRHKRSIWTVVIVTGCSAAATATTRRPPSRRRPTGSRR